MTDPAPARMVSVPADLLGKIVLDPYYYRESQRDDDELDDSLCFGCSAYEGEPHNPDCPMVELQAALTPPAPIAAPAQAEAELEEVGAVVREANCLQGRSRQSISIEEGQARSDLIYSGRVYLKALHESVGLPSLRAEYLRDLAVYRALAPAEAE